MNIQSETHSFSNKLSNMMQYVSDKFRKVSKKDSDNVPESSVVISPKLLRKNTATSSETNSKPDGHSRQRTQRQIDSFKKKFAKHPLDKLSFINAFPLFSLLYRV